MKMTGYHATAIENKESIIAQGINAMVTDKATYSDEQISLEGVFLFLDIDSAEEFGEDCCGGEYAIFQVEINEEYVVDPEYDGEAVFVERGFSKDEVKFLTQNIEE